MMLSNKTHQAVRTSTVKPHKYSYVLIPLILLAIYMLVDSSPASLESTSPTESKQIAHTQLVETVQMTGSTLAGNQAAPAKVEITEAIEEKSPTPDEVYSSTSGSSFRQLLEQSPDKWKSITVRKGDTLYIILKRLGLNVAAATLIARSPDSKQLVRITPGKTIHIFSQDGKSSDTLIYENSLLTWVHAVKQGNNYEITSNKLPTTTHIRQAKGEIISSLFAATKLAGISDTLTMNMAEIFGWDIDFAINVQPGDRFKLIYEDVYVSGSRRVNGKILAAEFVNRGKIYRAIAHRGEDGTLQYYSPKGLSMQKTFLRTPVKFSRISSRFSKARYHPVLKKTRAHKGVDYAAGRGTPIRATAKGTIVHAGRKGGYGNAVIIKHGSTYSTLYAHMSRFSRGIKKGHKVRQGQTIGHVGSTGLASGPHLHYEFRVNGKHVNPLTFKQPASAPIPSAQKTEFEKAAIFWQQKLEDIDDLTITASIGASDS